MCTSTSCVVSTFCALSRHAVICSAGSRSPPKSRTNGTTGIWMPQSDGGEDG